MQFDSVVDGKGLRCVLWTQGCPHRCLGCHNPQTHDCEGGFEADIDMVRAEMKKHAYLDGVTFSGGEPMLQAKQCAELASFAKSLGWNVWCYTGFLFEELLQKKDLDIMNFLEQIDVLIDGRFEIEKKTMELYFRGSSNQRCIDVQSSLKEKVGIEVE